MTWPPPVFSVGAVALVAAASIMDIRSRRIPNRLTFGAAAVAAALQILLGGWSGALSAGSGWAVGFVLFLPFYLVGGMGAGDVKLLAAVGAWLGPAGAMWTALYGAVAGGAMAMIVALARGYGKTALKNVRTIIRVWYIVGVQPVEGLTLADKSSVRFPYALPLAVGTLVTLWLQ
jgi:prepilin peptidase CpaA